MQKKFRNWNPDGVKGVWFMTELYNNKAQNRSTFLQVIWGCKFNASKKKAKKKHCKPWPIELTWHFSDSQQKIIKDVKISLSNERASGTGSSCKNIGLSAHFLISYFTLLHISHLLFGSTAGNNKQREKVLYAKHPSRGISILISLHQLPSYFHELLTFGRDNTKTVQWMELLLCDG